MKERLPFTLYKRSLKSGKKVLSTLKDIENKGRSEIQFSDYPNVHTQAIFSGQYKLNGAGGEKGQYRNSTLLHHSHVDSSKYFDTVKIIV